MITKKGLLIAMVLGAVVLGIACTQASTPTPTGETVPTDGGATGTTGAPLIGPSTLEAAGFTTFAAPQVSSGAQQAGIWVSGSGRVVVTPDLALLDLGVEARAATVAEARDQAARAMDSIMAVLANAGIDEKDIKTQFFNIQPEYTYNERARRSEITGYRVTNTVNVKVRDLEAVGTLIDQVATAGGDLARINNIRFTVEDTTPYATQAREAAVKLAMEKAQQFAQLTGVTLGTLAYIAESGANVPVVRDFAFEERAMAAAAAPPTAISAGEMDITVTVQAVFNIA